MSTDVRSFLKQLYHFFLGEVPIASSPKTCCILQIVSSCVSSNFWQNLVQNRCSSFFIILQKLKFDDLSLHIFYYWPTASDCCFLCVGKSSQPRSSVPSTSLRKKIFRAFLVYVEKGLILFEHTSYTTFLECKF